MSRVALRPPQASAATPPLSTGLRAGSVLLSAIGCTAVAVFMLATSDRLWHWFVVPVWLCGVVIGVDAVDWFRGEVDTFDPFGVIGLVGLYYFFLAPLLHPYLDWWMLYATPPQEWRDWLGGMAAINVVGLVAYRGLRGFLWRSWSARTARTRWVLDRSRFNVLLIAGMLISLALQLSIYSQFGGVSGYVETFSAGDRTAFAGQGYLYVVSEIFPLLAFMGFIVFAKDRPLFSGWPTLGLALALFAVLLVLFGGLRGSRANIIWALFWALGVVHFCIRPIPKRILPVGLAFLLIFMYLYGFYKGVGSELFDLIDESDAQTQLEQRTRRTIPALLLGDLGRSDVQALLLERMLKPGSDVSYAWGRTYLGAVAQAIPSSIWPERIPSKVQEGTDALYGQGTYSPTGFFATNQYGFAGEAMLNFGPFAAPLGLAALAIIAAWARCLGRAWRGGDARLLILPMLINVCILALIYDLDNVLVFLLRSYLIPVAMIWLSSSRRRI